MDGTIVKALSGFYYVVSPEDADIWECRARGKFRHQGITPLVGDRVSITQLPDHKGMIDRIAPRTCAFRRPAVANIDLLVLIAAQAVPVTDPFLLDRIIALAEYVGCEPVICLNKCDLDPAEELYRIYTGAGFSVVRTSAKTGEGVEQLRSLLTGKVSAFTGNSGVGKSSLLNALVPGFALQTGEVSDKLGRGRHTTRHVELFALPFGGYAADTPGFSSFDYEEEPIRAEELASTFREFVPYLDKCRFTGCSHVKEKGCAVIGAVKSGAISKSRHQSYVRLYEQAKEIREWERK